METYLLSNIITCSFAISRTLCLPKMTLHSSNVQKVLQFSRRFYGISRALLNYILITDQIQIANTGYYLQFYLNIRDISIFCLKYHKNNVEVYYSLVVGIGKLHYILCLRIIRCLYCSADNCMFLQPAPARINKFISRL